MQVDPLTTRQQIPVVGLTASTDEALAQQARGDPQAFAELYNRYMERIYRFVLIRTGSVPDAEDLTSQTFLAAWEQVDRYRGKGSFGGWLFGIARHKVADHYRRRRVDVPLELVEGLHHPGPGPEQVTDLHLQLARIARALKSLDAQQAEALALRVFGQLSALEVGQLMGKTEAAVKMLVHRGLRRLMERLEVSLEVPL